MKRSAGAIPGIFAVAALLLTLAALLTACDDHKGEHCAAYDTILIPTMHHIGKSYFTTYIYDRQCSQWVPNNPATVSQ